MTLDEAIKHCEELVEAHDKLRKSYDDASGYSRSHNEAIRTDDAKKHEKCNQDFRQLAEWLKELKELKNEPCEDAISREDAMFLILHYGNEIRHEVMDDIKASMIKLPSVTPKQMWIPVSESLPELDEDGYSTYVLVSFSNYTLPCIGQLRKIDGENHWYEGDDEKALDSFGLHVNAWMPMPESYTAESEEEE